MGTNRKLKTDGNLEIESAQVDINSDIDVTGDVGSTTITTTGNATIGGDIDVTGDVGGATATITGDASVGGNASVTGNVSCVDVDATGDLGGATATVTGNATIGGTLGVTGQATLSGLAYPTSDGTNGQALITNGSGTLSFGDVASGGGGVDTVTSATEAASYSGTNRIIHITATEAVTFISALSDRIIINETTYQTNFEANLTNCTVDTNGNVYIKNTSTNGTTDIDIKYCNISCGATFIVDNSGNTSGNQTNLSDSSIFAKNITFVTQATSSGYFFSRCNIHGNGVLTMPPSGGGNLNIWFSNVNVNQISGYTNLNSSFPSIINVRQGSTGATQIQIGGTDYLSSSYNYPFKVDKNGVDTNVIVEGERVTSNQSITGGNIAKIEFNNENLDNTNIFDPSTNYRITAKVKGYYKVTFHIYAFSITATLGHKVLIYKNGASIGRDFISAANVDGSLGRVNTSSYILNLSVGDYIEFYSDCTDNDYTITHTYTWFQFEKIN